MLENGQQKSMTLLYRTHTTFSGTANVPAMHCCTKREVSFCFRNLSGLYWPWKSMEFEGIRYYVYSPRPSKSLWL